MHERKWTEQIWNHWLETRAQRRSKLLHLFVMQGQLPVFGQKNPNSGHAVAKQLSDFPTSYHRKATKNQSLAKLLFLHLKHVVTLISAHVILTASGRAPSCGIDGKHEAS